MLVCGQPWLSNHEEMYTLQRMWTHPHWILMGIPHTRWQCGLKPFHLDPFSRLIRRIWPTEALNVPLTDRKDGSTAVKPLSDSRVWSVSSVASCRQILCFADARSVSLVADANPPLRGMFDSSVTGAHNPGIRPHTQSVGRKTERERLAAFTVAKPGKDRLLDWWVKFRT